MKYEINVAKNGKHFFATSERSIAGPGELERLFKTFKEKFPESDGYSISVSWKNVTSKHYDSAGYEKYLKRKNSR